jgi:protease I
MPSSVILVAQNFQDEEFTYPYYRLLEEGYVVDVATPDGNDHYGKFGVPARATKTIEDLSSSDYDVVILPGGFESPDRLRMQPEVKRFVREMHEDNKLVAAICHGPWICISAGIMDGKRATGYISIKDDVLNAGSTYLEEDVVIDGNLITSPHYRNNGDFMREVIKYVNQHA